MTCVIPFDTQHAAMAIRLLEWCAELSGCSKHACVLVVTRDTTEEVKEATRRAAQLAFSKVSLIKPSSNGITSRAGSTNFARVNLLFRTACAYAEQVTKQPFFWLEVDCVPLTSDWLNQLESAYLACSKPYMGFRRDVPVPHISAPAIYPANVSKLNPASLQDDHNQFGTISFDLVDPTATLRNCVVTSLIHHEWGSRNNPPTFPDEKSLEKILPGAVLFHRVKDDSLITRLRELRPLRKSFHRENAIGDQLLSETVEPEAKLKVVVVYVYPVFGGSHDVLAKRFVTSYTNNFPETPHTLYVISNGGEPTATMRETFKHIECSFMVHDDSGWDIGAYRKAAGEIACDLMVFFGGSTYIKCRQWLERMVEAFEDHGPQLFGSMGSLGHTIHIRTTGFWCSPELLNSYPHKTENTKDSRYAFEHGKNSLTAWAFKRGLKALVVTSGGEAYEWRQWNSIKNGFQKGNQTALLVGDRLCVVPYGKDRI